MDEERLTRSLREAIDSNVTGSSAADPVNIRQTARRRSVVLTSFCAGIVAVAAVAVPLAMSQGRADEAAPASQEGQSEAETSPTPAMAPLVRQVPRDPQEMRARAQVAGVLELGKGGCLTIAGEPSIWPSDAVWDQGRQEVQTSDGQSIKVGAELFGEGLEVPSNGIQSNRIMTAVEFERVTACAEQLSSTHAIIVDEITTQGQ